ncbi:MAG: hypothetical protein ABIQ30_02745 [Devosia sp.]
MFQSLVINNALLRRLIAWTIAIPISALRADKVVQEFFVPEAVPNDFGTRGGGFLGLRPGVFIATSEELVHLISDPDVSNWSLPPGMPVIAFVRCG